MTTFLGFVEWNLKMMILNQLRDCGGGARLMLLLREYSEALEAHCALRARRGLSIRVQEQKAEYEESERRLFERSQEAARIGRERDAAPMASATFSRHHRRYCHQPPS